MKFSPSLHADTRNFWTIYPEVNIQKSEKVKNKKAGERVQLKGFAITQMKKFTLDWT